ncbi:MAG: mechanosensitive ion channel domain-containing protein [Planctomycetota bacterium]|jgi:small-conductance mechanosensitive channel
MKVVIKKKDAIFALLIIFFVSVHVLSQEPSAKRETVAEPVQSTVTVPDMSEIIPKAAELSGRLLVLENKVHNKLDLASLRNKYTEIEANLGRDTDRLKQLTGSDDYRTAKLLVLREEIEKQDEKLVVASKPLKKEIRQIETLRKEWLAEKKHWGQWQSSWPDDGSSNQILSIFAKAHDTIETGLNLIDSQLETMLAEQQKVGALQEKIYFLTAELDMLIANKRFGSFLNTSPPMFSAHYVDQFGGDLWSAFLDGLGEILWPAGQYASQMGWVPLVQGIAFLILSIMIYRKRQVLSELTQWHFLAARPFSSAVFVISMISMLIYELQGAPSIWKLVNVIIGGFAFTRLAGILTEISWKRQFVYGLTILFIVTRCLTVFGFPLPLFRLYIVIAGLAGLLSCWRWARQSVLQKDSPFYTGLLRLCSVFYAVIIITQLWGNEALSYYLFMSVIRTIATILAFVLLIRMIRGGVEWLLRASPLRRAYVFYGGDVDTVLDRVGRFIGIAIGGLIFLPIILAIWGFYESLDEAMKGFWVLGFNVGSQKVTVGLVIIAVGMIYGTFLASWIIQKLLMDVMLHKRQVEKGVRLSIERLIHYFVIIVGFLLVISLLGFDLTKFTIIISALGVGIGFGLQGIVNNFVSGLILLFERPVRQGDIIEVAGIWAEVKNIGLRATTVQTFDQADLIIPNADLTTNQVTNWTLSSRQVRTIIPVGVAYGSDVPLVIRILTECAEANEKVAKNPGPHVLFLRFGESSLDFELRYWVYDTTHRLQTRSQLHQEIDRRFRESNIEIAFPQRDLHLRSSDESCILKTLQTDKK